jgi:serine/threonine protein kinase
MAEFPSEIKGYFPVCLCGRGAYGQVWLVTDVVGNFRALKVVSKSMLGGDWEREFKGLKLYQTKIKTHPNLLQIYHIEDGPDFFYYTMEAADNLGNEQNYIPATLNKYIERYNLEHSYIVGIFEQLLDAVDILHEAGLVHRDIKPENIIFVDDVPKLSDIGLATSFTASLSLAGTQSFVPPELLSGESKLVKGNALETDIYALGKTLYCVFSGLDATHYPVVPPAKLKTSEDWKFNRAVKALCHSSHAVRLKNSDEFRRALEGHVGFGFWVRSFMVFLLQITTLPWQTLRLACKNTFIRNFLLLLICAALVQGIYLYRNPSPVSINSSISQEHIDDYMELRWKKNLTEKEAQRLQSIIRRMEVERLDTGGGTIFDGTLPGKRMHKLIYQEKFMSLDHWKLKSEKRPSLNNKQMSLNTGVDIILNNDLPDEYEIKFTIDYPSNAPVLRFMVYDPNSIEDWRIKHVSPEDCNPEDYNPASFYWTIGAFGFLEPTRILSINNFFEVVNHRLTGRATRSSSPSVESLLQTPIPLGEQRISIVKTGNYVRVYCNGEMIYKPISLAWHGGRFRITGTGLGEGAISLSNLTVYDIGRKIVGGNKYQESSLVTPAKPSTFQRLTYLPYRNNLNHLEFEDWKIYNPDELHPGNSKAGFADEVMFAFRHELPQYYKMNFSVKRANSEVVLLKFFNELPEEDNLEHAFWSQPGLTVVLNAYTYVLYQLSPTVVCRMDNVISRGTSRQLPINVSIIRANGVLIVNNKFVTANEKTLGKYPAFYIYGGTDNPVKDFEIVQEDPFYFSQYSQSYFDAITLSTPQLKENYDGIPSIEQKQEGKLDKENQLKYLLLGLAYHSEKLKPEVSDILNNLPLVFSKTFTDRLNACNVAYSNWAVHSERYNTPEKHQKILSIGARKLMETLGISSKSAMEIMKRHYPMSKEQMKLSPMPSID